MTKPRYTFQSNIDDTVDIIDENVQPPELLATCPTIKAARKLVMVMEDDFDA